MCYHESVPAKDKIKKVYNWAELSDSWENDQHHITGFSHKKTPVITTENPHKIDLFSWGLIPKWVKDEKQAKELRIQTLNAKSETVFEKPSFRSSIGKKRCLVIVDGFYEWRDYNKVKYPYFIFLRGKDAFSLGGIYEEWANRETGEIINSFVIVTTEANPLMAKIHNSKLRMPLILSKEMEEQWLNPELPKEQIQTIMKPFNQDEMDAHTISKLITSRKENSNVPAVKEPFTFPELAEL